MIGIRYAARLEESPRNQKCHMRHRPKRRSRGMTLGGFRLAESHQSAYLLRVLAGGNALLAAPRVNGLWNVNSNHHGSQVQGDRGRITALGLLVRGRNHRTSVSSFFITASSNWPIRDWGRYSRAQPSSFVSQVRYLTFQKLGNTTHVGNTRCRGGVHLLHSLPGIRSSNACGHFTRRTQH